MANTRASPAACAGTSTSYDSSASVAASETPAAHPSIASSRRVTPIVGPRFECLHCRSTAEGRFNVCLKCEPRLHEPGGHTQNHAFCIKMPPRVADAVEHAEGLGRAAGGQARYEGTNCSIM